MGKGGNIEALTETRDVTRALSDVKWAIARQGAGGGVRTLIGGDYRITRFFIRKIYRFVAENKNILRTIWVSVTKKKKEQKEQFFLKRPV